jgi:hypothetical protein
MPGVFMHARYQGRVASPSTMLQSDATMKRFKIWCPIQLRADKALPLPVSMLPEGHSNHALRTILSV